MALSKYQEVAKRILGFKEGDFKLDMSGYTRDHPCGTSYCIVGWLAHQDGYPEEYQMCAWFGHTKYSEDLIGDYNYGDKWEFMFSDEWPNTLESAHKRAQYVLDNDSVPPLEEWGSFK